MAAANTLKAQRRRDVVLQREKACVVEQRELSGYSWCFLNTSVSCSSLSGQITIKNHNMVIMIFSVLRSCGYLVQTVLTETTVEVVNPEPVSKPVQYCDVDLFSVCSRPDSFRAVCWYHPQDCWKLPGTVHRRERHWNIDREASALQRMPIPQK